MPAMTDKYDAKCEKKSLFMLKRIYKQTKLDGSFQRFGGYDYGSGWTTPQACSYISNFLNGSTFNKVINVDVEEALKYCKEINDKPSILYFKELLASGHKYVSIDGNNSASYLVAFIDGKDDLVVESDEYSEKPVSFNKMVYETQLDVLHTEKIEVVILRKITINDMCHLFRALNTQTKLNGQEWRQARVTPLAQDIRDFGTKTSSFFMNFIFKGSDPIDKRTHEEILAQLALKIEKDYKGSLKGTWLDYVYENTDVWSAKTISSLNKLTNHVVNLDDEFQKETISKRLTRGQIHNLFEAFKVFDDESFKVDDYRQFFEWFLKIDAGAQNKSKSVLEENLEEESYTYWTKYYGTSSCYRNIRSLFRWAFLQDIDDLKKNGVVSIIRKSSDRFTWAEKLELYDKQKGELRSGEKISILDLYFGKYEADHVKSVKDGGTNDISNGELMTVLENRQKGANSNQPHFDFQR